MKARLNGTNDTFAEITQVSLANNPSVVYDASRIEFEQEKTLQEPTSDHWQDVRERAAIAAMQGVMNFFGSIDYNKETIAKLAVEQADALITILKEGSK